MSRIEAVVEEYLAKLWRLRSLGVGTAKTSYYWALEGLLNAIGRELKPRVLCLSQLADQRAGHPDFGLYTANQCQRGEPRAGAMPERGVVEVKPIGDDAWLTAETPQITKYFDRYRLVLVIGGACACS